MKQLKKIILSICIVSSIQAPSLDILQTIDTQQIPIDISAKDSQESQPQNIITFIPAKNKNISGSYWPAPAHVIMSPDGKPINSASAYIGNDSYSDVVQLEVLIEQSSPDSEIELLYLGYFINPESEAKIYLYGIKDEKDLNDEDFIIIEDDDED
jgi:hypothetical protein